MKLRSLNQRKNELKVSIRRQHRQSIFKQLRKKNLQNDFKYKYKQLIPYFQLQYDSYFQSADFDPLIFINILFARQDNLLRITFIKHEMIDQKLKSTKDKSVELEEVNLPKQYPFLHQTLLYDTISKDLYFNPQKYKSLEQDTKFKFIDFWIRFLKRNKYMETSRQPQYHSAVINLLQNLILTIDSKDLRQQIYQWVRGTQSLVLIYNCLTGDYMPYSRYSHLYQLILTSVKHKKQRVKVQALSVLIKCISRADYDEIDRLLFHQPALFSQIIYFIIEMMKEFQQIQRKCQNKYENEKDINQILERKQLIINVIQKASTCISIFMQTYDENIHKCTLQGAGYVGAILICQRNHSLILNGLTIFQHIINVYDKQDNYERQCLQFLMNDSSILETGVWNHLGFLDYIRRNKSLQIRRKYITFMNQFLSHSDRQLIQKFAELIEYKPGGQIVYTSQDLIDILINIFLQNDDPVILQNSIQSLSSIGYYASHQVQQQQIDFYQPDRIRLQKLHKNSIILQQSKVFYKISNSQMLKKLNQIAEYKLNFHLYKKYPQKIVEIAEAFLQQLNLKTNQL